MPTLSSILVQRGVASLRAVEEAISRQVLHGGDLPTNLLELGSVEEAAVTWALAETYGLEAAPIGRLPDPDPAVLRLVPGELALRQGVFPLSLQDRTLVLATSEPLPAAVEDDLGFALDVTLKQLVAPLVRVRQAMVVHYGIALDRRLLRLVAKLDGRADPSPSTMPPAGTDPFAWPPRPLSIPVPTFGTGLREPSEPASGTQEPAALALDPLTPGAPSTSTSTSTSMEAPKQARITLPSGARIGEEKARAKDPPAESRALAGWVRNAAREDRKGALSPLVGKAARPPRRKGPFTAPMAELELDEAGSTDDVLDTFFAFAQQFFVYAALFAVHGDLAEGRDASGPGAERAKVVGIGVPLDLPSTLARARNRRVPILAPLAVDGLDAELARDLGRASRAPAGEVAVLPIVVRNRTVALLYGDDGDAAPRLSALGDLISMAVLSAAALERILLRKKRGGALPSANDPAFLARRRATAPPPARGGGAAALARALALPSVAPAPSQGINVGSRIPTVMAWPTVSPPVEPSSSKTERSPAEPSSSKTERSPAEVPAGEGRVSPTAKSVPPEAGPPLVDEEWDSEEGLQKVLARVAESPASAHAVLDLGVPSAPAVPSLPTPSPSSLGTEPRLRRATAPAYEGRPKKAPLPPRLPEVGMPWTSANLYPSSSVLAVSGRGSAEAASESVPSVEASGDDPIVEARPISSFDQEDLVQRDLGDADFDLAGAVSHEDGRGAVRAPALQPGEASPGAEAFVEALDIASIDAPFPDRDRESSAPYASPPRGAAPPIPGVLVDAGAEYAALLQSVLDGGPDNPRAFAELVKAGEPALPVLMAQFPGPLLVDRHRARNQLPAASQCGPILELLVAIRRPALPFVVERAASDDVEIRFWATHLLGELRYPEAANALVPRLFDGDAGVRRIARRSATGLVSAGAPGHPILEGLDQRTRDPGQPNSHRVLAIETMGEIRTGAMVPPLLSALADASDEVADAARRALLLVARQDFGRDSRRWGDWWAKHGGRHRLEWLIDALTHEQPSLRRAAGDELKQLTKEYFGYYDDLPKKERERAQALYRSWWETEGRRRFP